MNVIIKRNGKEEPFEASKIRMAIGKANNTVEPIHKLNDAQLDAITHNVASSITVIN